MISRRLADSGTVVALQRFAHVRPSWPSQRQSRWPRPRVSIATWSAVNL